jgi:uncharacterized protein (TIGR02246 family)
MKPRLFNRLALLLVSVVLAGCGPRGVMPERPLSRADDADAAERAREGDEMDKSSSSATPPHKPEDWPGLFTQRLNAGDLDGVIALYDPDAHFVTPSGETLVGRDKIRRVVAGLIDAKTRMHSKVVRTVTVGDVTILYTDFQGTTVEAAGKPVEIHQKAIEVLRRQPDGTWRLIVGDPNGRSQG